MKQWIEQTLPEQIESLKELVRIPSVSRGEPKPGMPFGEEVHRALTYTLELANQLGFEKTKSLDGYCGYVDFGEGEEQLLIMSHLDVVPAGAGWVHEPFEPVVEDGRIYGRGVQDDKGAAVSSLYALAAVKAAGIPLRRSVRLLFGCDEERGSDCIKHYKTIEKNPTLAFTPDADYPCVNSEKGITQTKWKKELTASGIRIACGTAANVIPGEVVCKLPFEAQVVDVPEGYRASFEGDTISVFGCGGHGASPAKAKNALYALLKILSEQPLTGEDFTTVSCLHALFGFDLYGEGFNLAQEDESGKLTLSLDCMHWNETGVELTIDCRHPVCCTYEKLMQSMQENLGVMGFALVEVHHSPALYMPADSELVRTLVEVYEEQVGHPAKPLAIGGGTYARSFPNAVGTGVTAEGEPGMCHMPDESLAISTIQFNTNIIAECIARLAGK